MNTKNISGILLAVLALVASGCGSGSSENAGTIKGLNEHTKALFTAKGVRTDAKPGIGSTVLTPSSNQQSGRRAEIVSSFTDGRSRVRDLKSGQIGIFPTDTLIAETNPKIEGIYGISTRGQVVKVLNFFVDGSAYVEYTTPNSQTASSTSNFNNSTNNNSNTLRTEIVDGLIPEVDGTGKLFKGKHALTKSNQYVEILLVFADGRALVTNSATRQYSIETGLSAQIE